MVDFSGSAVDVETNAALATANATLASMLDELKRAMIEDALERIQQQLATINEDDNLAPKERRY